MDQKELQHTQKIAEDIARCAGEMLINFRGKAKTIRGKRDALDIVTEADEASEAYILSELHKFFPDHAFLSEESGESEHTSPYRWIIDPLDGTKEFARGIPLFCVNIALEYEGEIIVGVVYMPLLSELYSCARGCGAFLSGKPIHVSKEKTLDRSMIIVHPPRNNLDVKTFNKTWKTMGKLARHVYRFRALASDIFSLSWIALGAYEAFYVPIRYPFWWDIAPGLLLVTEAGGTVTTARGNPLTQKSYEEEGLLVTNGNIHKNVLTLIS